MAGIWGQPQVQPQGMGGSMISFISDEAAAANYPVAPGTTVALITNDLQNGKMFIKSTGANGLPNPTRVFEIHEITPTAQGRDGVSRKEFDDLRAQMQQLLAALQKPAGNPVDNGGAK